MEKQMLTVGHSDATAIMCPKCGIRFDWCVIRGEYGLDEVYKCPNCGMDKEQAEEHEFDAFPLVPQSAPYSHLCPECGGHGKCLKNDGEIRIMTCNDCDSFWRIDDNK